MEDKIGDKKKKNMNEDMRQKQEEKQMKKINKRKSLMTFLRACYLDSIALVTRPVGGREGEFKFEQPPHRHIH